MKKPALTKNKRYRQGIFTPENPEKFYIKDGPIIYRSGLELRYLNFFDRNPNVLFVASEEITVEYLSKVDMDNFGRPKKRRYFPDFVIKVRQQSGEVQTFFIEIKPKNQTVKPTRGRNLQNRLIEYQRNLDKWEAATKFCKSKGIKFEIMTEETIKSRG